LFVLTCIFSNALWVFFLFLKYKGMWLHHEDYRLTLLLSKMFSE
jgi:hypothetical protein